MHFDQLNKEERKTLLKQICGAIVEYGHKLCIATKCTIHSDDDRRAARHKLSSYKSLSALQASELASVQQQQLQAPIRPASAAASVNVVCPPAVVNISPVPSPAVVASASGKKKTKEKDKHKKRSEK